MRFEFTRLAAPVAIVAALAAAPVVASSQKDIAQVESHIAATQSMTANFVQTDGKGRQLKGTLSMKRPGRIRFDYGAGSDMLLVGDGKTLTFVDYAVGQKSSWAISKTPLALLLASRPDLGRIARTVDSGNPNVVIVRARDVRHPEFGTLVLAFSRGGNAPGGLRLEGWTAIDAQNKKTTVRLSGQRYNVAVPESAFTYAPPKKR